MKIPTLRYYSYTPAYIATVNYTVMALLLTFLVGSNGDFPVSDEAVSLSYIHTNTQLHRRTALIYTSICMLHACNLLTHVP